MARAVTQTPVSLPRRTSLKNPKKSIFKRGGYYFGPSWSDFDKYATFQWYTFSMYKSMYKSDTFIL